MDEQKFFEQFRFKEDLAGCFGIERERFLRDPETGLLVPRSEEFLGLAKGKAWGCELSACQVEDRTAPLRKPDEIRRALEQNDNEGFQIARQLGLQLCAQEVAEPSIPLDVYPNPRYLRIVKDMPEHILRAACQVIGTHIHVGMPNMESAIDFHNTMRQRIKEFCVLGDHSDGERLRLYKAVASNWMPPHYESFKHFFEVAIEQDFADNPRNCWHLIRISIHGTVELRMFGMTEDLDEILFWVQSCREEVK